MLAWKSDRQHGMPKSGFFIVAHIEKDGAWVYEIAWYEPKVSAWIVDANGLKLRMEMGSLWSEIQAPE